MPPFINACTQIDNAGFVVCTHKLIINCNYLLSLFVTYGDTVNNLRSRFMKINYKAPKITNEMSNSNSGFNETYSRK